MFSDETDVSRNPNGLIEGVRIDESENFCKNSYAALKRFFEKLLLGTNEPVLSECSIQGSAQRFRGAGLGEKPENPSLIDGIDSSRHVRIAR